MRSDHDPVCAMWERANDPWRVKDSGWQVTGWVLADDADKRRYQRVVDRALQGQEGDADFVGAAEKVMVCVAAVSNGEAAGLKKWKAIQPCEKERAAKARARRADLSVGDRRSAARERRDLARARQKRCRGERPKNLGATWRQR